MMCRLVFLVSLLATTLRCAGQPDLIIWGPTLNPKISIMTFSTGACEVVEGCTPAGTRRLLAFDTETRNIGTTDLVLGNPANNPLFEYAPCHDHYHFRDFATYQLLDASGRQVALGLKVGFCLEDIRRWDSNAPPADFYTCDFQGIQAGWGDVYVSSLPCQWIDLAGVPAGVYTLRVEVDPANHLTELNETNNTTGQFVVIDGPCTNAPPNDQFANAQVVEGRLGTILGSNSCATRENGEPKHNNFTPAKTLWYRWLPNYTGDATITTFGSTFDTVLAAYRGSALNTLTSIAANDDAVSTVRWSSISFRVTNGVAQLIAVDGFGGAAGGLALNINPVANDRFTNCLVIANRSGNATGINVGATIEPGEPTHGAHSLWYCWTAPTNGSFRFYTHGSSIDTGLAVYRGTALSNLTRIVSNDDARGLKTSAAILDATAGGVYFLAVTSADEGFVALSWEPVVSPRIASITRVTGSTYRLSVSGQTNDEYIIQFSPDLRAWTDRARVTNSVGLVTYTDTASGKSGFYRAVSLP
jgi:hypothetical protein